MNKKTIGVTIFGLLVLLTLSTWVTYTIIVAKDEGLNLAWGNVESTYQRRFDLIPNLVQAVKGYAEHERETFETVAETRAAVGRINLSPEMLSDAGALAKFQATQGELSNALTKLLAVAENYPDLKASNNFRALQDELAGTENRINVARRDYNIAVASINKATRGPFGAVVNSLFLNIDRKQAFSASEGASKAPVVNFN